MTEPRPEDTVRDFQLLYYGEAERTWYSTFWLGTQVLKCPLDLWIYQELLHRQQPDVIVETGTAHGGSAFFLASMCQLIGTGRVITIDNKIKGEPPEHELISYVRGSSVAADVVSGVRESIGDDEDVMVILDSRHSFDHVLEELRCWSPAVSPGQYLIVEDTNLNGHPIAPDWGPGPKEAVDAFLAESDDFEVDTGSEKFFLTWNPGGYLRRRSESKTS